MTLVFNPQLENSPLDTVRDALDSGGAPGYLEILDGSTVLATLGLSLPSFADESAGQSVANPIFSASATATGTATGFAFRTALGDFVFGGDIPDDLNLGTTSISVGALVNISSYVLTAGTAQAREYASTVPYPYVATPSIVTFVGAESSVVPGSGAQSDLLSVGVPAGVVDGDLLVFFVLVENGFRLVSSPAGLTQDLSFTSPGMAQLFQVYSRVASSEPANYQFSLDSPGFWSLGCCAYRNATTVTVGTPNPIYISPFLTAPSMIAPASGANLAVYGIESSTPPSIISGPLGMASRISQLDFFTSLIVYDDLDQMPGATPDRDLEILSGDVAVQLQLT